MNAVVLPKTRAPQPVGSLVEVRKRLRVPWYRSPIDKSTLWALMERSDLKGFAQTLTHIGLVVIMGALAALFFQQEQWALFALALPVLESVGAEVVSQIPRRFCAVYTACSMPLPKSAWSGDLSSVAASQLEFKTHL